MTDRDEDDKEEERPEELNDQLDLIPPAVCDVLPEQEEELPENPHHSACSYPAMMQSFRYYC